MYRTGVVVLVLVISAAIHSAPAAAASAADCNGPTIEYEAGEVDRGDEVTVWGTSWGDACYDTGAPPEGEGVLGTPGAGIEVVVAQRNDEVVVARGSADDAYEFVVDVVVPASLDPGEARILARTGDGRLADDVTRAPLVVSDGEPSAGDDAVAEFGPGTAASERGASMSFWLIAGALVLAAAGAVAVGRRR